MTAKINVIRMWDSQFLSVGKLVDAPTKMVCKGAHSIYAQYACAYPFHYSDHNNYTNTAISVNYIDCVCTSVHILTA